MDGFRPRSSGPAGSGPDGPSGNVFSSSCAQQDALDRHVRREQRVVFKPLHEVVTVSDDNITTIIPSAPRPPRRKGKEVDDEPSTSEPVQNPRSCLSRDLSKVQRYARECPAPTFGGPSRPSGLRDSRRESRGRGPSPSRLPPRLRGKASSGKPCAAARSGRWVEDLPPEPRECQTARELASVHREGGSSVLEHASIRAGEDDGYGPCPSVEDDEGLSADPEEQGKEIDAIFDWIRACNKAKELLRPYPKGARVFMKGLK